MRLLILLLLFSAPVFAQSDSIPKGPLTDWVIIDGRDIVEHTGCDHDTVAQIHRNVTFEITNPGTFQYTFQPGSSCYLELITKTKNCTCKDCQRWHKYIIELSGITDTMELAVDSTNLTEIWWNSWSMPTKENVRSGTLKITGREVSLQLLQYFDKKYSVLDPAVELKFSLKE